MTLAQAAVVLGAELHGTDAHFENVCADSRAVKRGDLFIALRGERYDGHDFLTQAAAAGAAAALVDRAHAGVQLPGMPTAVVGDTTVALGVLAAHWRRQFHLPLIAVAGSNGKTTVKEMIAACLRRHFGAASVLATHGNLNNHIGVPLTLLALRAAHRAAVVEIGMNHPGETAQLAALAAPTIAVVNNAQREHQEFMRSVAEVAAEHASLVQALPAAGVAVINADDAHAGVWRNAAGAHTVRDFGLRIGAVRAQSRMQATSAQLEVMTPEGKAAFVLPLAGQHNVCNALAAIAAATAAGVALDTCAQALARFVAVKGRLQVKAGLHGATLIDDTYNANPDSVRAAIDVLAHTPGRRLLVLGDMGEVGAQGVAFHQEAGAYARDAGIERLYALGDLAVETVHAFGAGARHYLRIEDLLAEVENDLGPETVLLVKGSRFMQMERVVRSFEVSTGSFNSEGPGDAA